MNTTILYNGGILHSARTKKLLKFSIIICFVLAFVVVLSATVVSRAEVTQENINSLKTVQKWAYDISCATNTNYADVGGLFFTPVTRAQQDEVPNDSASTTINFMSAWNTAKTLYNALAAVGLSLTLVYATLQVVDASSSEKVSPEQMIKISIKLVFAVTIINNGTALIEGILSLSNSLLSDVFQNVSSSGDATPKEVIYEMCKRYNFWESINAIVTAAWSFLGSGMVYMLAGILVYGRMLRICVLGAFAPIGFSDAFNGMNSGAFKYAKKFLAIGLQGVVIMIMLILFSTLQTAIGYTGNLFLSFSMLGMLFGSKKLAEQIVGVN